MVSLASSSISEVLKAFCLPGGETGTGAAASALDASESTSFESAEPRLSSSLST